jgi:hypothetical protein
VAIKWTRDNKSECGRFWCYKPPRADEWQMWDRDERDERGGPRRYCAKLLRTLKTWAERIVNPPKQEEAT